MTSSLLITVLFASLASHALALPSNVSVTRTSNGGVYAPGDIIFQDEFDYINRDVWRSEVNMNGGYNQEFQIYDTRDENAYTRDGVLYLRPSLTVDMFGGNYETLYNGEVDLGGRCTDPPGDACYRRGYYPNILPPAVSARFRTLGTFSFHYGKFQARAKLPSGDWTWPAIWMMPENSKYGGWPMSGEIDIMESRGNRNLRAPSGEHIGVEQVGSTMHFGPRDGYNGWWAAHGVKNSAPGNGYDNDFHIYELEWTPTNMRFSVDGQEIKNVVPPNGGFFELGQFDNSSPNPWTNADNFRMAPFDQNFHLILNNAVGGSFFPQDSNPRPPWVNSGNPPFLSWMNAMNDWKGTWNGEEHALKIDYIRIYAV